MTKDSQPTQPSRAPEVVRGEVVDTTPLMAKSAAVKLTGRIKKGLDDLETRRDAVLAQLDEAYRNGAWRAMGYASWKEYTATEFQLGRVRSYQLVNWAELNRELEAEGSPPAQTEREARRIRQERTTTKSTTAEGAASPPEVYTTVYTATPSDLPKRARTDAKPVKEHPARPKPPVRLSERIEQAFKTDSVTAAEALLECKPTDARDWDPLLFARLESWVAQAAAVRHPKQPAPTVPAVARPARPPRQALAVPARSGAAAANGNGCAHKDAAGKETVKKLPYGIFCDTCGVKVR